MLSSSRRPVCARCQISRIAQPQQTRNATLIKRPKRPYTFTQLITLSDGSTFLHRTTSPEPVYRSTKDTKNNALWNPSSQKLLNVEEDEAGRLARFRARFGRGWDIEGSEDEAVVDADTAEPAQKQDSLTDLMAASVKEAGKKDKAKNSATDKSKAKAK